MIVQKLEELVVLRDTGLEPGAIFRREFLDCSHALLRADDRVAHALKRTEMARRCRQPGVKWKSDRALQAAGLPLRRHPRPQPRPEDAEPRFRYRTF
jgi:hypothetical protein